MLLVDVVVGRSHIGYHNIGLCPMVPDTTHRFNSLVDNLSQPTIFVVQDGSQAYPSHVITYHERTA